MEMKDMAEEDEKLSNRDSPKNPQPLGELCASNCIGPRNIYLYLYHLCLYNLYIYIYLSIWC